MTDLNENNRSVRERKILEVFDRKTEINALDSLINAFAPSVSEISIKETAIILDSSVFLRIGLKTDVVDYLSSVHTAPLILPGQAIQEFWNNYNKANKDIAIAVKERFRNFNLELAKIENALPDALEIFTAAVENFCNSYEGMYDESTTRITVKLLGVLKEKAIVYFATRSLFSVIVNHRKKTKTPPGFMDDGDGDFFIWVDTLASLLIAKENGQSYARVALVTNDVKIDWTRGGVAHPILDAEIQALIGLPFKIWSLSELAKEVASAVITE